MKKLLNKSWTGAETWFHEDGDKIVIETRQDVTPILENNSRLRNEFQGFNKRGPVEFYRVASFPPVVVVDWMERYGLNVFNPDHHAAILKKLNDLDWRKIKTVDATL